MPLRTAGAHLVGVLLSLVIYGYYAALVAVYVSRIIRRRGKNYLDLALSVVVFSITTAVIGLKTCNLYVTFTQYPDDPIEEKFSSTNQTPICALLMFLTLNIVDVFLIWRLWSISNRKYLIMLAPCVLLVGSIVTCMEFVYHEFSAAQDTPYAWVYGSASFIVALNLVITSLIATLMRKGASVTGQVPMAEPKKPRESVITTIVHSGAVLTLTLIVWLIVGFTDEPGSIVMNHILQPIIAVVHLLIPLQQCPTNSPDLSSGSRTQGLTVTLPPAHFAPGGVISVTTETQTFHQGRLESRAEFRLPDDEERSDIELSSKAPSLTDYAREDASNKA